ncbi:MlaA family lipoprotein [Limnohabitans radicicola]|uniref:VacJ family lipoprotein n=1 Tax=Limnohabitans radicicola TaxID=2771427 RepID=A0A927FH01_9BURK|nr:VacJ family lipoprotein [Limnohabitans radicicola]MBD8049450.1 VacJ family lipoprotein [Limnohabitans radicicola]
MSSQTLRSLWLAIALAALQCSAMAADARDPWEAMNRRIYAFNDVVDTAVVRPVAQVYDKVLPKFARTGVHNFLGNLSDVWSMANSALQLKGQATAETLMRVSVNSVFGMAGVLDIATEMGIEKRKEDFGQTLGYWGVPSGPYVVLPILGPSTLRDGLALPLDFKGDPSQNVRDTATRSTLTVLRVTDLRASLLKTVDTVKAASLDPYSFVRDAYLQKRENDIYDGNPPSDFDYNDPELSGK